MAGTNKEDPKKSGLGEEKKNGCRITSSNTGPFFLYIPSSPWGPDPPDRLTLDAVQPIFE